MVTCTYLVFTHNMRLFYSFIATHGIYPHNIEQILPVQSSLEVVWKNATFMKMALILKIAAEASALYRTLKFIEY